MLLAWSAYRSIVEALSLLCRTTTDAARSPLKVTGQSFQN